MARETKVGLLIGVGVILLIAIIVNNLLVTDQVTDDFDNLAEFAHRTQEDLGTIPSPQTLAEAPAASQAQSHAAAPSPTTRVTDSTDITTLRARRDPQASHSPLIPSAEELRTSQWQPEPEHEAPPRSIQGLQSAVALDDNAPRQPQSYAYNHQAATQQGPGNTYVTQAAQHFAAQDPATASQTLAMQTQQQPQIQDTVTRIDQPRQGPGVVHYVKRGETLSQISRRYYGEDKHWRLIAEANRGDVDAKGNVLEGVRLVIPNLTQQSISGNYQQIDITPRGMVASASHEQQASRNRIVTVEAGDTLSRLAARHLGDAKRFREIYELNRDQMKNENALVVGMKLKLPLPTPAPAPGSAPGNSPQSAPAARPAPTTAVAAASQGKTYTVVAGDTLSKIAAKTLGDSARYKDIFEANRKLLASADDVKVGQELRIP